VTTDYCDVTSLCYISSRPIFRTAHLALQYWCECIFTYQLRCGTLIFRLTVCPILSDRCHVVSCLSVTLVYCGQTVGWIKIPLGSEVGLGPGHIVLDGDQAPQRKGHISTPTFRTMSGVAKRSLISAKTISQSVKIFKCKGKGILICTPCPKTRHV